MNRITEKHLQALCDRLNKLTGSPLTPYAKDESGKFTAQIGCYHIDFAYGGVELVRIENSAGGVSCPIHSGHTTKRDLYNRMTAFIGGIELNQK